MRRADSLEKTPMLGQFKGWRRRGWQRMSGWMASLTQWTWVWANSGSWWWRGKPGVLQSVGLQRVGHNWMTELNWEICQVNMGCENIEGTENHWGFQIDYVIWIPFRKYSIPLPSGGWSCLETPNKKITSKYNSPTRRRFPSLGSLILNKVKIHQQPSLSQATS